jgi:tetratricopeptide (TPR) repeat protein
MVIDATVEESALLLKSLEMVEEDERSSDIFLSFGDEFVETRRYVEVVIERQQEQITLLNEELRKLGREKLPGLPETIIRRESLSELRLKELFTHLRNSIEPERRLVWVFYPLQDTGQEKEFADLFESVARGVMADDFGDTKIIIRDTPSKLLAKRFEENQKVFFYDSKLDLQTIFKKMEADAKNENLPKEERIQNVMLLAGVDVAEKRYDDALAKNQHVLRHYQKEKQKERESIVQNNIGDIYYLQGQFPEAQQCYEKAILIAVGVESQPLVMYQSINLGNALFMQQKFDESLVYYDSAEKLAGANQVLPHQVQALERIAEVKRAQDKPDEAIEILAKAADICRQNKYDYGLMIILRKLVVAYDEKGDEKNRRAAEKELDACTGKVSEVDPNLVKEAGA